MRSQRHDAAYESKNWIEDLAVCKQSGVGFSTNQIYREDGNRQEEHPFEDRNVHTQFDVENKSYLYAVFDGHDGIRAVDFCVQRMPAEILLGQLTPTLTDEEVKEVLRQAFVSVEKGYMDSINDLLAERVFYEGLNPYQLYNEAPEDLEKIKKINYDLSSGTAAAVALIFNNKLFVANVGNCRMLLCQTDTNGVLKVVQLTVDHNLKNEDEILRLSQIGIKMENIRKRTHLGNQENTRCLGNYMVKGGYKELEDLASAVQEPIIAEPDVIGGINLDSSHRFMLLMSAGLYNSLEDTMSTDQVNKYISQCVVEQFRVEATLSGVAQAVVDKIVRSHHDWYAMDSPSNNYQTKREDITLVVRNFNFPLPNAMKSPTTPSVTFNPLVGTLLANTHTMRNSITNTSTNSDVSNVTECDPNERQRAYVNFKEFYDNVKLAKSNGTLPDGIDL